MNSSKSIIHPSSYLILTILPEILQDLPKKQVTTNKSIFAQVFYLLAMILLSYFRNTFLEQEFSNGNISLFLSPQKGIFHAELDTLDLSFVLTCTFIRQKRLVPTVKL